MSVGSEIERGRGKIPMLERAEVLNSSTSKVKSPQFDSSIFMTIVDAAVDGVTRPVEIHINSKQMELFQWVNIMTRLVSAHLQNDGPFPAFVVQEMITTHDPKDGGYVIPASRGVYCHGLVSHLGMVLEQHCIKLGLMEGEVKNVIGH